MNVSAPLFGFVVAAVGVALFVAGLRDRDAEPKPKPKPNGDQP